MVALSAPVVALDEVLKLVSRGAFRNTPAERVVQWGCKLFRRASFGALKGTVFPVSPTHSAEQLRNR